VCVCVNQCSVRENSGFIEEHLMIEEHIYTQQQGGGVRGVEGDERVSNRSIGMRE